MLKAFWSSFCLVLGGFVFFFVVCNTLLGPTCVTHIRTAVQTEKLPSLGRLRRALKAAGRVRPLIENAQGALPDDLDAFLAGQTETMESAATQPPGSIPVVYSYGGTVHAIVFVLLLVNACVLSLDLSFTHVGVTAANFAVAVVTGIAVIAALVKQHRFRLPHRLGPLTWWTLGYVMAVFCSWYILIMVYSFMHPTLMQNQWDLLRNIAALPPGKNPIFSGYLLLSLGASLILGLLGLSAVRRHRKALSSVGSPLTGVPL